MGKKKNENFFFVPPISKTLTPSRQGPQLPCLELVLHTDRVGTQYISVK